jgi:hypothetical protein
LFITKREHSSECPSRVKASQMALKQLQGLLKLAAVKLHLRSLTAACSAHAVKPFCPNFKHQEVVHGVEDRIVNMTEVPFESESTLRASEKCFVSVQDFAGTAAIGRECVVCWYSIQ